MLPDITSVVQLLRLERTLKVHQAPNHSFCVVAQKDCKKLFQNYEKAQINPDTYTYLLDYILSSAEGDECSYLEISILGVKLRGLLDSGTLRIILGHKG